MPWYETREFFEIDETQIKMHTGYRFGLRACLVTGLQFEEFDSLLTAFASQLASVDMRRLTNCPEYVEAMGQVAFFASTARSKRGRNVTVIMQVEPDDGGAEVLAIETVSDNADQPCTDD